MKASSAPQPSGERTVSANPPAEHISRLREMDFQFLKPNHRNSAACAGSALRVQHTSGFSLPSAPCRIRWLLISVVHEFAIRPMFK
jgi:hypothetical protein